MRPPPPPPPLQSEPDRSPHIGPANAFRVPPPPPGWLPDPGELRDGHPEDLLTVLLVMAIVFLGIFAFKGLFLCR